MRAILVDDEPIMLRSFVRNSAGVTGLDVVAQFQDAESAIAYAKEHTFELALLDVGLPQMDGFELADKLRRLHPDLLIVFVSAHGDLSQAEDTYDYYLPKPYNKISIEKMLEKITELSCNRK